MAVPFRIRVGSNRRTLNGYQLLRCTSDQGCGNHLLAWVFAQTLDARYRLQHWPQVDSEERREILGPLIFRHRDVKIQQSCELVLFASNKL
ncbi:hypothetical protein [Arthrobacter sp. SLBN-122]|uniref:hypothetical protein n=1 Tax=Arthrobacter sp. SLBN-122 TaxID=2768455 RepID=UPI00116F52DC|nr:hypothetical protein [Arthrobacter sp. SLBN-122]TQJ33449.1 hypothetical protein FBY36_0662 [Arthrobacter sp. SLBN-122]